MASATGYITKDDPPILILAGGADREGPKIHGKRMKAAYNKAGLLRPPSLSLKVQVTMDHSTTMQSVKTQFGFFSQRIARGVRGFFRKS